jgi:hypothetical protein
MATMDKLTRVYIKIRDARAKLAAEFKQQDDVLQAQLDQVKAAILTYLKDHDLESVRTDAGLVYRTTRTRYWTSDWEAMHRFVLQNELPEFLEKRLNQSAVKAFLEEHPEKIPPGLNTDAEYGITVRKT